MKLSTLSLVQVAVLLAALGCTSGEKKGPPTDGQFGNAPPPPSKAAEAAAKTQDEEDKDPLFRANRHYANGNLDEAIREVRDELHRNPENPRARYFYAVFLIDKGELRGAAIELQHTLALNPRDVPVVIAWTRLGEIRERLGEHQAALDAYIKAIEAERDIEAKIAADRSKGGPVPNEYSGVPHGSPEPWRNVARISLYLGDLDRAVQAIDQARTRAPRDPFTESLAVRAYQRLGDDVRALDCARRFLEIAGEEPVFAERVRELKDLVRGSAPPLGMTERKLLVDFVRNAVRPRLQSDVRDEEFFAQSPNPRLLRADDRAIFVTMMPADGSLRIRGRGRGKSLAAAIAGAVAAIKDHPKYNPTILRHSAVRIDVERGELEPVELSPAELVQPDEPVALSLTAKPEVEPGVHGVALRVDNREIFCLPGDSITEDLPDVKAMLEYASRAAGLAEHAWENASARVLRFKTESFCSPSAGAAPVELVRGEPLPYPEAQPETLFDAAQAGAAWLAQDLVIEERPASEVGKAPGAQRWLKETMPNGEVAIVQTLTFARFHYNYRARTDQLDDTGYNEVRHAGAAIALVSAFARTGHQELRDAGELAARWLEDRAQQEDGGRVVVVVNKNAKLGTQALTLVLEDALAMASTQEDPVRAAFRDGLARTIVGVMRADGTFSSSIPARGTIPPRDNDTQFAPSEAVLALVRHFKATSDRKWLDAATKAADGRIAELRQRVKEGMPLLDSWLARALAELDEVEGIDQDAKQADRRAFALEIAKTMVAHQAGPDRGDALGGLSPPGQLFPSGMPTASLGEGLASVAAMARRRALPQARELRDAARNAASFAMRHQYTSRNSWYLPNAERARGAFRSVLSSSKVRIDGVQHNVEFLLLVEKLLRD